ncbi:MAG: PTS sugar transporter subunit IIA [Firmicutes bacterium]|nr:PTS sugar transporter subunit IIA [Bacillota bacterium]MCL5040492.1 PTS sugar transporter subunit IIA [Bacillota bacterium]
MTAVVILGHGDLASGLLSAANLILGETGSCRAVGLNPGESLEGYLDKVLQVIHTLPKESDVLCLVDLFGGTPANVAALLTAKGHCRCLTGANLPMLLEILTRGQDQPLEELAATGLRSGVDGIVDLVKSLQASSTERGASK